MIWSRCKLYISIYVKCFKGDFLFLVATELFVFFGPNLECSDMGCHIDGFIAVVAHTHVVQSGPITGKQADVVAAANTAAEVALRLVRPGKKVNCF